ncbi:MAG TPA: thioredoxin family protein [Armatimonadota bacterium]
MNRRFFTVILSLVMMFTVLAASFAVTAKPATVKKSTTRVTANNPAVKTASPQVKKTVRAKTLPKLLDLGADKCIPCKMMFPVLDDLKKGYKGRLAVQFIDVWKNPSAKDKYKIKMIPTQIFYDAKGKEVFRHEGYFPKEDILAEFKKHGIKL